MRGGRRGSLAIVLHTHMPYVEGFGTWPFGEEWLWEAMTDCYLELLELLEKGAPLTLSLTPVLCDQLEVPDVRERFERFVAEVSRHTHEEDVAGLRAGGHEALALELERSRADVERALDRLSACGGDLLGALAPHAQWTSSATHAVLPMLATDAGVRAQVQTGVDAHRARFGAERFRGGFWLPECAYAPWLQRALTDAGVSATCIELTNRFGLGAAEHLQPLQSESGVLLVPIDRATISLAWSDDGYPASGAYRDYHHHTVHRHRPWSNDGEVYDHARALRLAREHAADFVSRTIARLRDSGAGLPGGGLAVFAVDTELLVHWWHEGLDWLAAVVEECSRQGLALVRLDDALETHEPAPVKDGESFKASSWGKDGDLSTWSGPAVAEMAFATRAAELSVVAAGNRVSSAAVRELLALQASDWAFMVSRGMAAPYARERFDGHRAALAQALSGDQRGSTALRNLAAFANRSALLSP